MTKSNEPLKPCPLCGNKDVWDKGWGISCRKCGLWLGDGTQAEKLGGYLAIWNTRPAYDDGSFDKAVRELLESLDQFISAEPEETIFPGSVAHRIMNIERLLKERL